MMRPMSWMIRCLAALLAVTVWCAAASAQTAAPAPAAPEVTLSTLRGQLEQMPDTADTEDEVKRSSPMTTSEVRR